LKTISFDRLGFGPRHTGGRQEQKADADLDGPVKGTEDLTALDTLIFCLAVAVIKEETVIVQARREFNTGGLRWFAGKSSPCL
jgi:hypothetical protein